VYKNILQLEVKPLILLLKVPASAVKDELAFAGAKPIVGDFFLSFFLLFYEEVS
jgi:hypothetical protein